MRRGQHPGDDVASMLRFGLLGNWEVIRSWGPTALTAISPLFFGAPQHGTFWWTPGPAVNLAEATLYVGQVPLLLALYGFARVDELRRNRVWLVLAVFSLGVALALPIFNLVNYAPGFALISNPRLRGVYRFALIIAATIAFDRTTRDGAATGSGEAPPVLLYSAVAMLLPLTVLSWLGSTTLGGPLFARVSGVAVAAQVAVAVILVAMSTLWVGWKRGWLGRRAFRTGLIVVTFADAYWFFGDFNTPVPSSYVFPKTPVVEFLERDPSLFRVSSSSEGGAILLPNTKLPYGFYDVDLFSVLAIDRFVALQMRVNNDTRRPSLKQFRFPDLAGQSGLINLMNIKYFIVPAAHRESAGRRDRFDALPQYRIVYDSEVAIYENREVLPRAFLTHRAEVIEDPDAVLSAMMQPDFDARHAVILENPTSPKLSEHAVASGADEVEILDFQPNRIVARATTFAPAYMVFSEAYHPGWKAKVNGLEAPIFRADYLFRAIHLAPGSHRIELEFLPNHDVFARWFAGTSLAMVAALAVLGVWRRRPAQTTDN